MSLGADLRKIAKKNKQKLEDVNAGAMQELSNMVMQITPVQEGTLKNNWLAAIGKADLKTVNEGDGQNASAATGQLNVEVNSLQLGSVFYFTNKMPYAKRIEYDAWSANATAGMLRVSLAQFPEIVERRVKAVK